MHVERLLQISIACLAAMGSLLLGMGQESLALPMVAVFAAGTAAYFTDYLQWFHMGRWVANLAALLAVLYTLFDFFHNQAERQLLAIANLLIYLQMILLYQHKSIRVYWHLIVLSLLQVVVAAALNPGMEFGLLLIAYMFLALFTLSMLFVHAECLRFAALSPGTLSPREPRRGWGRSDTELRPNLFGSPDRFMLNRELFRHVVRFGVTTLLLTVVLFFLSPRLGRSAWRSRVDRRGGLVGFQSEVSLNEFGRIRENPETVLRAQFTTAKDGKPYHVYGEPYFRGSVLNQYKPIEGKWTARTPHLAPGLVDLPLPPPSAHELARQTILLQPMADVFSTYPVYRAPDSPDDLRLVPESALLIRKQLQEDERWAQFRYELLTAAFRSGMMRSIVPVTNPAWGVGRRQRQRDLAKIVAFEESYFPRLTQQATEILAEAGVTPDQRLAAARALEGHFRQQDRYRYTLDLRQLPPLGVDPIEYFVAEHRSGHCEYFASALALMLRSQGIPARLVVGYRGGDYNRVGHYFLVRELHAHAWVEAYLEPAQVPPSALADWQSAADGAWLRLDPTPGGGDEAWLDVGGPNFLDHLSEFKDYFQVLWVDYVVGLTPQRQREAIYEPLMQRTSWSVQNILFNPRWWSEFGHELVQRLGLTSREDFRDRWLHWRSVPLLLGLLLLGIGLYYAGRLVWRSIMTPRLTRLRYRFDRGWENSRKIEFYHRLERVLARYGMRRAPTQTPQEFAQQSAARLQSTVGHNPAALVPTRLVELFYRVRYGTRQLEAGEIEALDQSLHQLEQALSARRRER